MKLVRDFAAENVEMSPIMGTEEVSAFQAESRRRWDRRTTTFNFRCCRSRSRRWLVGRSSLLALVGDWSEERRTVDIAEVRMWNGWTVFVTVLILLHSVTGRSRSTLHHHHYHHHRRRRRHPIYYATLIIPLLMKKSCSAILLTLLVCPLADNSIETF